MIFCRENLSVLQARLPDFEELAAAVITKPFQLTNPVQCIQKVLATPEPESAAAIRPGFPYAVRRTLPVSAATNCLVSSATRSGGLQR